jgi:four helix bundle protein
MQEKRRNDLSKRLYDFALKIVLLVKSLPKELASYEIGRQLLKAGTSIAANHEEARGGFSKEDFIYKMSIAFKEARETHFWLRLLKDSKIVKKDEIDELISESKEIRNILGKSVSTAKLRKSNM